jgi:sulfhydrogenase subunit delta
MKKKLAFYNAGSCRICAESFEAILSDVGDIAEMQIISEDGLVADVQFDAVFISGSISSSQEKEIVLSLRQKTSKFIALGYCAISHDMADMRGLIKSCGSLQNKNYGHCLLQDNFGTDQGSPVQPYAAVDACVYGCPFTQHELLRAIKVIATGTFYSTLDYPVCMECKMQANQCLFDKKQPCLGPVTRAGCRAVCPSQGISCVGCRGFSAKANKEAMKNVVHENRSK